MSNLARSTVEDLAPLHALVDDAYPERLREIAEYLFLHLAEDTELVAAVGHSRLAALALGQTDRLSSELGGGNFYMHKGVHFRLSKRDRQIWDDFNGHNIPELVKKYKLTDVRIGQIIDTARRADLARRQGALPFDDEN
jgi:Mor family transcriptional regulator